MIKTIFKKLTYLGTEGSDRKTNVRFGFSRSDLPRKHTVKLEKNL